MCVCSLFSETRVTCKKHIAPTKQRRAICLQCEHVDNTHKSNILHWCKWALL